MDKIGNFSPTTESVHAELSSQDSVTAWDIVKAILSRHPQYGNRTAREIERGPTPELTLKKHLSEWLDQLNKLFDHFLVKECHQRAVLSICSPDWYRVISALTDDQVFPEALTFSEFEESNLHPVSSFSGETDSEREAALKRGFY